MLEQRTETITRTSGFRSCAGCAGDQRLIFLATLINYIDRQTISVLAPTITRDLGLSNTEFGGIIVWFLLAYTISQGLSGKLYDRIGTRRGFICSITLWSLAAMAHAFARGVFSLSVFRFVLGLGEAGNWPGAAKTVAEWFPIRERAFGMAIFNRRAIGSMWRHLIIWLSLTYGGRRRYHHWTLGFGCALWVFLQHSSPSMVSEHERRLISEGQRVATEPTRWLRLRPLLPLARTLRYRQRGRLFWPDSSRSIWWLYLTWNLRSADARGFSLVKIAAFAWFPFVCADAGGLSVAGCRVFNQSRWIIDRAQVSNSFAVTDARRILQHLLRTDNGISSNRVVLLASGLDQQRRAYFSDKAVASVAGLGGTGAGISSMIFTFGTRW